MSFLLLATKLYVPPAPPKLVARPRLTQRLNEAMTHRLTLVSAPAGFGKTMLLAEWIAGISDFRLPIADLGARTADAQICNLESAICNRVAWLSLDESDNDPARFLTYLVAALQRVDPTIGQAAQAMLQAPQLPPPETLLMTLINDVAATSQPFALILDDYHLITAPPIHQQLAFLLEHQPSQMHLVIVSREDPPLPLSRWRARGQMVEIRQADLKFTEAETADFLRRVMQLDVSSADVAALHRHTEGWIAGLQLAALSMRGQDDVRQFVQSFTGSNRYILDYLIEEVFQRQPAEVQDFLLQTSILDRLTAPLCDAVVGQIGNLPYASQQTLAYLESANLFILPLDESRQWYRYHHLFADLLRHRLETVEARDPAPLHRRASAWYEANGFPADAVRHALAASDWERAATLILGVSETMLKRGEVTTLLNWLKALPDDLVRAHPQLCLFYSWTLILTGQLDAAESYLKQAEAISQNITPLLGGIIAAQAYVARARGDDHRTIELSQRALSLFSPDALTERSVAALNLGIAHWNSGHLTEAEPALTEAERAANQSGNHYARLIALTLLGVIQGARGRLHQAEEFFQQAIRSGGESPAIALAHLEYSTLLYEWNDLETAADHLQRGLELSQRGGNVEVQIGGYRTLARLKQAQGDASAALEVLEKAHQFARDHNLPPAMRARNAACHVQIALAQNDIATAIRWAEQVSQDADASPFYPLLGLTPVRLLLAQNEKAAAAQRLQACYETALRAGWQFAVVEVRALQALAAPTLTAALAFLADALTLAQPEDYVRTFLDKGEPMRLAILDFRFSIERQGHEARSRRLLTYVNKLLTAFGRAKPWEKPQIADRKSEIVNLAEPLSKRELDVLRLVAVGRSNPEIAEALFVSVNTVKTHLMRLYAKLGVNSRTAAVTRARELELL